MIDSRKWSSSERDQKPNRCKEYTSRGSIALPHGERRHCAAPLSPGRQGSGLESRACLRNTSCQRHRSAAPHLWLRGSWQRSWQTQVEGVGEQTAEACGWQNTSVQPATCLLLPLKSFRRDRCDRGRPVATVESHLHLPLVRHESSHPVPAGPCQRHCCSRSAHHHRPVL